LPNKKASPKRLKNSKRILTASLHRWTFCLCVHQFRRSGIFGDFQPKNQGTSMNPTSQHPKKHHILVQIFELIDALPENKKMELLQRLALKNIDAILYQIVMDLNQNHKVSLLDELNELVLGKREHPRKSCVMATDYVVDDRAYRNFVKDISESGVYVQTSQAFEIGDQIIQSFSLSDKQIPFKFTGEIVRLNKDGVGIRFKNLTQYQRDILRSILKNLA
jgi:hypothetical protein